MCFSVRRRAQNAPFREAVCAECAFPSRCGAREVWGNRPPGCGALWKMVQLGKCARATTRQPAGRVVPGSANLGSESGLTEKRILYPAAHGKTHSGCCLTERRTLPHPIIKTHSFTVLRTAGCVFLIAECVFSVTFRNHPDCIALSRHLRSPLTAPSHVRGGHRSARRRLRASAQSKGIRPPARHGSRTRVWHRRPRQAQRPQALAPS